jgi:predicted RNase H-like HicB family nuclease
MQPFLYRIIVEWSAEDDAYVARVPALAGCAAHGDSEEDAAREARVAASAILDVMHEHGDPIPSPDATPDYSGNIRLRLPRYLHERLARSAEAEGVSLNQLMTTMLAERSAARRPRAAQPKRKTRRAHVAPAKPRAL